jgi:hypothetical protein
VTEKTTAPKPQVTASRPIGEEEHARSRRRFAAQVPAAIQQFPDKLKRDDVLPVPMASVIRMRCRSSALASITRSMEMS